MDVAFPTENATPYFPITTIRYGNKLPNPQTIDALNLILRNEGYSLAPQGWRDLITEDETVSVEQSKLPMRS